MLQLRLPRVALAVLVGAGLGVSGMVFQGLFRNPLADPAVIGVSSGAALGAIVVIVAGGGAAAGGLFVSAAAFAGALATAFVVYRLARVGPAVQVATLLLAGIAIAAMISSVMSLVMSFSGEQIRSIYFWLLGGLSARGWSSVTVVVPFLVVGIVAAASLVRDMNLVALGEERASQLGVEVASFKRRAIAIGALLAAAAVSVAGVIGFVGLMTAHVLRLIVGADNRRLLPAVLLGGPDLRGARRPGRSDRDRSGGAAARCHDGPDRSAVLPVAAPARAGEGRRCPRLIPPSRCPASTPATGRSRPCAASTSPSARVRSWGWSGRTGAARRRSSAWRPGPCSRRPARSA